MRKNIYIVTGMPNSGIDKMVRILDISGLDVSNNAHNTYNFEGQEKRVIKLVSNLLFQLPQKYNYKIIFMESDIESCVGFVEKDKDIIVDNLSKHLGRISKFFLNSDNVEIVIISYESLLKNPGSELQVLNGFFHKKLDFKKAIKQEFKNK